MVKYCLLADSIIASGLTDEDAKTLLSKANNRANKYFDFFLSLENDRTWTLLARDSAATRDFIKHSADWFIEI